MIRAVWHGHVIAESDATILVEGDHYFPPESVDSDALLDSATTTRCFWKGKAEYRNLLIDGEFHGDMAWTYPKPGRLARRIEGYVAFSPGVAQPVVECFEDVVLGEAQEAPATTDLRSALSTAARQDRLSRNGLRLAR